MNGNLQDPNDIFAPLSDEELEKWEEERRKDALADLYKKHMGALCEEIKGMLVFEKEDTVGHPAMIVDAHPEADSDRIMFKFLRDETVWTRGYKWENFIHMWYSRDRWERTLDVRKALQKGKADMRKLGQRLGRPRRKTRFA